MQPIAKNHPMRRWDQGSPSGDSLQVSLAHSSPSAGSGIGTGPGVIQDRYSPTMGRHRTNPLFNGHSGHIAPPPQSQFDMGPKSFVKSNQVSSAHRSAPPSGAQPTVALTGFCHPSRSRTSIFSARTRATWPSSRSSPRTCLLDSARKDNSMRTR